MPSIFTLEGHSPRLTLLGTPVEASPRTVALLVGAGLAVFAGAFWGTTKILGRAVDRQFSR